MLCVEGCVDEEGREGLLGVGGGGEGAGVRPGAPMMAPRSGPRACSIFCLCATQLNFLHGAGPGGPTRRPLGAEGRGALRGTAPRIADSVGSGWAWRPVGWGWPLEEGMLGFDQSLLACREHQFTRS